MGPVTLAVLGADSRGTTFSRFAEQFPDRARVVAVAEPRVGRPAPAAPSGAERSRQTGAPVRLAGEAARYA